jgi:type II secretion system protein N
MNKRLASLFSFRKLAGNRRLFLLCLLLFSISAIFSFGWFFPADVVQRRLVQQVVKETGLKIQGYNASMLFPFGIVLDLYVKPEIEPLADIELMGLEITPAWHSLITDDPAIYLNGNLAQGDVDLLAGQSGLFDLSLQNINVLELQNPANDYLVRGALSGQMDAEKLSADFNGQGGFIAELKQAQITGLQKIGLPSTLNLGSVQIAGKFNQRRISFERILAAEGVMELSGGGTLLVGETPEQTRLNLNVRLHPTQGTPVSLRSLIKLTGVRPTADGSYLLRIGGTLAKPVVR